MLGRQRSGSVLCPSCGKLVGVADERCLNCGRRNPGMWGFTAAFGRLGRDMGFVQAVIGGCILFYILMLTVDPQHIGGSGLFNLLSPSPESLLRFGASGAIPVFLLHRWWTLLSAGWLHGSLLHIGLNLYWVRILAPEVAELYGAGRMVIIYTASSVAGFLLSSALGLIGLGGALTVGASAPLLGFLGALVYYGRRAGSRTVGNWAWSYALFMIVLGFLPIGGVRIDNAAHIGGFAGGYLVGLLLDPLRPERGDHLVAAVVCLVATALSVVASLVVPVPAFGR
ncbi:MAG TPA: rhomboid family intramembrane serine protease [Thermoanaerobaculia bacterium]|nr:rhomboid family intramembrane serine protease [Thermoanaerobaculia bacterium]